MLILEDVSKEIKEEIMIKKKKLTLQSWEEKFWPKFIVVRSSNLQVQFVSVLSVRLRCANVHRLQSDW